jgi:hypothetical protein
MASRLGVRSSVRCDWPTAVRVSWRNPPDRQCRSGVRCAAVSGSTNRISLRSWSVQERSQVLSRCVSPLQRPCGRAAPPCPRQSLRLYVCFVLSWEIGRRSSGHHGLSAVLSSVVVSFHFIRPFAVPHHYSPDRSSSVTTRRHRRASATTATMTSIRGAPHPTIDQRADAEPMAVVVGIVCSFQPPPRAL